MTDQRPVMRRRIDPLALMFGLGGGLMAAHVLSNGTFWFDLRWALGGTAIVVGLVLLTNSIRRKSH